jgi:uncharacterized protein
VTGETGRRHQEGDIIVFMKSPVEGSVKTRLARVVGSHVAAELYRCFVTDILAMTRRTGYLTHLFVDPGGALPAVQEWLGSDLFYYPQTGEDLGARMSSAFRTILSASHRAVLIGSDCPDLPESVIDAALEHLTSYDAVIGPAQDGGYYLIGFTPGAFCETAFASIAWGTSTVFAATMDVLQSTGLKVHVLPNWRDVDEYDDLVTLYDRQKQLGLGCLATIDFLRDRFHW